MDHRTSGAYELLQPVYDRGPFELDFALEDPRDLIFRVAAVLGKKLELGLLKLRVVALPKSSVRVRCPSLVLLGVLDDDPA